MKVAITGGTGFIGTKLIDKLLERKADVTILTRNPKRAKEKFSANLNFVEWNYNQVDGKWVSSIAESDVVIHLAGEPIMAKRWNKEQKYKIRNSRVEGTKNIINKLIEFSDKEKIFISASAIGYYGDVKHGTVNEDFGTGKDFLARVTDEWETASLKLNGFSNFRRVLMRTGIVLSSNNGALAKMLRIFKLGIGGKLGNGKQWFPWIHIDDLINMYLFAIDNKDIKDAINCTSPNAVTNKEFTKALGKVLRRPAIFSVPKKILKFVLGDVANVLLTGAKVFPKKLLDNNFDFKFDNLDNALKNLTE